MAPKKNHKPTQDTMLEEPIKDRKVLPKSIREEEPRIREDQDEPESEEEQRSLVLFTPEQLEVLFKMNRPNFSELVAAFKGGSSKNAGYQRAKPENFNGAHNRKVVDAWLAEMEDYLHAAKVGRHSTVELAQFYLKGYAATW
jgi:signal recognition particle GTPase